MASRQSQVTTDHDAIRRWIEERGGRPAVAPRPEGPGAEADLLCVDFPGTTLAQPVVELSWDDWFRRFEDQQMALVFEETTPTGERSQVNKLVSRTSAQARAGAAKAKRAAPAKAKRAAPAKAKRAAPAKAKRAAPAKAKRAAPAKAKRAAPAKARRAAPAKARRGTRAQAVAVRTREQPSARRGRATPPKAAGKAPAGAGRAKATRGGARKPAKGGRATRR